MRLATVIPAGEVEPVPVVAARDGPWIPLGLLAGRPIGRLEEALPGLSEEIPLLVERAAAWPGAHFREAACRFLPPVMRPTTFRDFYAFEAHVKTARARRGLPMAPEWYEIPAFYFSNPNSLVGHGAVVAPPAGSTELDYELELGVVIGKGGRDIAAAGAWSHVAGFTLVNDLSSRDLQRREMAIGLGPAKGKDFATAVGPWIVSREAFADRIEGERLSLALSARVNGRELSRGNVADLHHTIPQLISHASRDAELRPGDLLGTGTVGTGCLLELGPEAAGGWLKAGDVVELEAERIGVLSTRVGARPEDGATG